MTKRKSEVNDMPNMKNAIKKVKVSIKKNESNNDFEASMKTAIKKVEKAVKANDKEAAVKAYNEANSVLDKASTSHIKKKNYVSRQKSRLAKAVNSIQ